MGATCALSFTGPVFADDLVPLNSVIKTQGYTLPTNLQVPAPDGEQYYLYTTGKTKTILYTVYIDLSAKCHGAKYCNLGSLTAERNGKPQMYYDINKHLITETIPFGNRNAYYTPAHAMADYWPALLQWQQNNILYTLSWQDKIDVSTLIEMAQSIH